jgi:GNAT superfamily N-acetyltransferase
LEPLRAVARFAVVAGGAVTVRRSRRAPDVEEARVTRDTEDLLVLWVQARAELGGTGRPLLGSSPDVIRPRLVDALTRRDDLHILLARWQGRPAGFAIVRVGQLMPVFEGECVQLEHLFVTAPLRRHGVARALLAGVAGLAERSGADQILSGAPPSAREMHRFLARLGFTPLVLRRVAATATLRRRLAGESRRSGLEDLLSRRRSSRARSNRLATPPGGLMLSPPVPAPAAEAQDVVPVVDLPAVERPDGHVVGLAADLAVADPRPAETTVASLVTQRGTRRGRSRAAASSPGRASEGEGPGPAA